MPRKGRLFGESGMYHVIIRGINKQIVFEEDADYLFFLSTLEKLSEDTVVSIHAYCLMNNHVHLLLSSPPHELSSFMKRLEAKYAFYFNHKYGRCGALFQGRFKSEPVENECYFLSVFRYILNNPSHAGICHAENYPWSSYSLFGSKKSFVDIKYIKVLLKDYSSLNEFLKEDPSDHSILEYESYPFHNDTWALEQAKTVLGNYHKILPDCSKDERDSAILKLLETGLSIRQIARVTGIGRGVVRRLAK